MISKLGSILFLPLKENLMIIIVTADKIVMKRVIPNNMNKYKILDSLISKAKFVVIGIGFKCVLQSKLINRRYKCSCLYTYYFILIRTGLSSTTWKVILVFIWLILSIGTALAMVKILTQGLLLSRYFVLPLKVK